MARDFRQQMLLGFEQPDEEKTDYSRYVEAAEPLSVWRPPPPSIDSSPAVFKQHGPSESEAETPAQAVSDLSGKTVYVVDSYSLIYQVFHAMPSDLTSPNGQPVGAVHGFVRDILDLIEKRKPDYLFAAFDHPSEVFRLDVYPEYKIHREAMPEELRAQIGIIRRFLDALGVAAIECPSYEADDVMATLAREVDQRGGDCVLVTSDKDCRQLITDRVRLLNIRKNLFFDEAALLEHWGIRPEQVVDFQALVGDAVDNVPGVPLIGPKIARELLEKYDTLESVLEHAGEVSGVKRRENLLNGREQALMSRKLVRLVDDVPVEIDWDDGRVGGMDRAEALDMCGELGFRRLTDRISMLAVQDAPSHWEADYLLVANETHLQYLVEQLRQQKLVAFDTETTDTNPCRADLVGYSFCWQEGQAWYVPVRAPKGQPQFDPQDTLDLLRPFFEDPAIAKVGQNVKYDQIVLRSHGVTLRGVVFDTMVADYLLSPGERTHDLDDLAKRYLNHRKIKIKELIGSGKKLIRMDQAPVDRVAEYACEDADVPLRLHRILSQRLGRMELTELYDSLEMPLIDVLVEMEFNGVKIDLGRLAELSARYGKRMETLEREIHDLAGVRFNIESPKQLAKILFDDLGLPVQKKTKSGPSTDAEVLLQLTESHELPAKIMEYRQNAKLKGTYVDALPMLADPDSHRVHTSFKQDVAATGRLSSQDPNLQNIPIRTQEGREIRSAFLPGDPDWMLLSADYSQIELRVLAHVTADETLCEAFRQDQDIHARVAAEVFGVPLEGVTSEMRRRAKAVNFGVIYGQTSFGLAKSLGIEKDDAADFIEAYFARYPGVDEFVAETLDRCRETGYVSTILGRRRNVDGVRSRARRGDARFRTLPERIAVNTVIQGSAADLIKRAMINIHRRLATEPLLTPSFQNSTSPQPNAGAPAPRLLLQIHDELVFELPSHQTSHLAELVTEEMTSAADLIVPLRVDIKAGKNWAECEPWK